MTELLKSKPSPLEQEKCVTCKYFIIENAERFEENSCQYQTSHQKGWQLLTHFFIKSCKGKKYQNNGEMFQNLPTKMIFRDNKKFEPWYFVKSRFLQRLTAVGVGFGAAVYILMDVFK